MKPDFDYPITMVGQPFLPKCDPSWWLQAVRKAGGPVQMFPLRAYLRSKTMRRRGAIWTFIRQYARRHKTFTFRDLMPPLTRDRAESNVVCMTRIGELRVIRKGYGGTRGKPSVVAINK